MHEPGGISLIDAAGGTGQNFSVENLNARNADEAGTHLRFNDPIGGLLVFSIPSTGYNAIKVSFSTRRSSSGAGTQNWWYSLDGTSYTSLTTIQPNNGDPKLVTLDLSGIAGTSNNPMLKLKVAFVQGSGGLAGNNRFDNVAADGNAIGVAPPRDSISPIVNFSPENNSTNIPVSQIFTITFNEPVRLISNGPLDISNASSFIEMRQGRIDGAKVPVRILVFDGVPPTITVEPMSPLRNNETYFITLESNRVEDTSNNAISERQVVQFTTIGVQTQLETGDLAFIAYRMNAVGADDEVALLTFKDLIPGTLITLTDSKYTTNATPQCSGGILWVSPLDQCVPAGTVITIQTSALVTNIGKVSGGGFGLSSNGDQVIVYTGSAAQPHYITALTSIAWVSGNTSCGGSLSAKPAGLTDGTNSINTSTAPGNTSGLSVNAFYQGPSSGNINEIRDAVFKPSNWVVVGAGTPPQTWPNISIPTPPRVSNASTVSSKKIQLAFSVALNELSATTSSNYRGIDGIQTIEVTKNGPLSDTVTILYASPFDAGKPYVLSVADVKGLDGQQMSCAYSYTFTRASGGEIKAKSNFIVTSEGSGTLEILLDVLSSSNGTIDVVPLFDGFSTASPSDVTLVSNTVAIEEGSSVAKVMVTITDDAIEEQSAEYVVLALRNPIGCVVVGDTLITVFIRDNDRKAPVPTKSVELEHVSSFDPSGTNSSSCEIVAYDPESNRLFSTSAIAGFLDIIDFSQPAELKLISSVDINQYGGITSVAVKNGMVAVACPNKDEHLNGKVLLFDVDGKLVSQVTVGALPDMIVFTPDGKKILTANEGQPTADYSIDPEGSISVIDVSNGPGSVTQANVTTLLFTKFNAQEAELIKSGVRKTKASSTLSADIEPEYIAVSSDSKKAWVTLQENNAIAEVDLSSIQISGIWPLGTKDFSVSGNGFDASDNNGEVLIANWPVRAFFIPDGVATYSVGTTNYIVTANEGDEKEYGGLVERTTLNDSKYVLDAKTFPNAAFLKQNYNLGRMRLTNLNGDTDGDGDIDVLHCVGSRSFSIWNADTKTLVYDSGDDFEMITSSNPTTSKIFNSDHESNSLKNRSRSKGPEPEGVVVGQISNKTYAFVALERVGGVMVYDVSNPQTPRFVDYNNARGATEYSGDNGPESLTLIHSTQSSDKNTYLVVANEVSGTLTIFKVIDNNSPSSVDDLDSSVETVTLHPNPATSGMVMLSHTADVVVMDIMGRIVFTGRSVNTLNVAGYTSGTYIVYSTMGSVSRLVILD
ncbi:MAG: Ig-like domain-containing protein [Ignavibacteria bacterium]|nr:Ig-like domain-containing protein [Ignavibacteria bacterium]